MGNFEYAEKIGLRDKVSKKLIAVYPFKVVGATWKSKKWFAIGIINRAAQPKINS